jgi:hypothetical protein
VSCRGQPRMMRREIRMMGREGRMMRREESGEAQRRGGLARGAVDSLKARDTRLTRCLASPPAPPFPPPSLPPSLLPPRPTLSRHRKGCLDRRHSPEGLLSRQKFPEHDSVRIYIRRGRVRLEGKREGDREGGREGGRKGGKEEEIGHGAIHGVSLRPMPSYSLLK